MKPAQHRVSAVAEIQGLYGPFTFSEKLLQQIWARGDFDQSALILSDGRKLRVVHPGRWNHLGGPDFQAARLRFDAGPEVTMDVELHLLAGDWAAHRHAADPAYAQVGLHVVLFPPSPDQTTIGANGTVIPSLALLSLLHHDLEEYAAEAAIEGLAGRPLTKAMEILRHLPLGQLNTELRAQADKRWRQKVHFARLRIEKLGWAEAAHSAALEILGYRFNRAPMLRLASRYPLGDWSDGRVAPERAYAEEAQWSLQGVRPANQPRRRLQHYAAWTAAVPDWPARLESLGRELTPIPAGRETGAARREYQLTALRRRLATELCQDQVGGTRWDNLVCDGWLPLLAARTGRDLAGWWMHWFPGDQPPALQRALRELAVCGGRGRPVSHGLVQGLLGRMLALESGPA
jgi:hypothetical protein